MNNCINFFLLAFIFFSGCAFTTPPDHLLVDPAHSISATRLRKYENFGVDYVTIFKFPANTGMVATEAEFKEYDGIPVVEGNWRILALLDSPRLYQGEAFLAHEARQNPLDFDCKYTLMAIFPGYLNNSLKILLSGRDYDTFYRLTGEEVSYNPELFNDKKSVKEYREYIFRKFGISLGEAKKVRGPYYIDWIKVGTKAWEDFKSEFVRIMPLKINVGQDMRATRLSEDDFRNRSNEEPGHTVSGRVMQKGMLSASGIAVGLAGGGIPLIASAALLGDTVSATIDDRPSGLYAQSFVERESLATGANYYERWCRQRRFK